MAELTTRAAITTQNGTDYLAGGSIGVFVTSTSGGRYEGSNIKWTYNDGWELDDAATVVLFENDSEKQQIAAYYPYNENLGTGNVYSITLPEAYDENYEDFDYLYGASAPLASNPATIGLNHLMTKVTVVVQSRGTELGEDEVASIDLVDVPRTVAWTVPSATLSGYGDSENITLYRNGASHYGYALPNGAQTLTLYITTESGRVFTATTSLDDNKTADVTEKLTSGMHYKIGVIVGKDKVKINSVSVEPWGDGGALEGGEATEVISYKYDEASNTYTVYNANGLYAWNEKVQAIFADGTFNPTTDAYEYEEDFPNLTLAADITLKGENNWTPIGGKDEDDRNIFYTGTINGDGHTITGLRINSDSGYQGFIGRLGEGGTVKNLTFTDAVVSAGQYSGIVVGGSIGTIENCHVTSGSLTTTYKYAGGIVGSNGSMVIDCTNAATIAVAQGVTNANNLGGIAGNNSSIGIIMGCINTGAISSGNTNIGGVLGDNDGIVVACSNKGTVTGSSQTGGIVGRNAQGFAQIIGSWTISTTESDNDGDGIGKLSYGTVTSCFTGDAATINAKVSEMNDAIAAYNSEGKTCPYTWQAGTDGYPTLVKSE